MASLPTMAEMRTRFHELGVERERISTEVKPLRDQYNALCEQAGTIRTRQMELAKQFKPMEAPLVAIDQERAVLARALNGKTGSAPVKE